ncbi:MAG: HAMP domain-containing methyl-accepting chemotaxis protein [Neptuniibacter sp.]
MGVLRKLKVTTRILILAITLVSIKVLVLGFLLMELDQIGQRSLQQQAKVVEQNGSITQQAELIAAQSQTQMLQQQAQKIQKAYSDMLFWYFDGTITLYYESLDKAALSADELEEGLTKLAMEPSATESITPMLKDLADYREIMQNSINYYQQGRANIAAAEISDAHLIVQDMNTQLLSLTEMFQQRLKQANEQVEQSLDQNLKASVAVKESSEKSTAQIEQITQIALLLLLVTVPLSVVIAVLIIFSITQPLKRLRQELLTIENNSDLTHPLSLEGRDEIREMSEATQKLLEKLRTTLNDVGGMASELKSTADDSYQVSMETHQQSTEQQNQSEGIASAAAQLGASAEDISRTMQQGLNFVEGVQKAARKGQQDVNATANSINQLDQKFADVESSVKDLASQSESIGRVLDVIRDIADQTNLLALNAAIEAARAGDQGRGFAVVADEVRTLAQRTSASTDEIQQMVESLQGQSRNALGSLDANRSLVDTGVALSQTAETSLEQIQREMQALIEMNQAIAVITQEQQQAVVSVDEGVQTVRDLASQVENRANSSKTVNQDLNKMAELLQSKLLLFKL